MNPAPAETRGAGGGRAPSGGSAPVSVLIGIGSNLGDRAANIRRGLALLERPPDVEIVRLSSVRETEPVGGPPQGRYLNAAAEARTTLAPLPLLDALLEVEAAVGRVRSVPNAPRELDLDLLLYGDRIIDLPRLQVPHPRLLERAFVLEPLAEIAPERLHPRTGASLHHHWLCLQAEHGRT
jgi:2-amino-4-hydroxy-6-hydroxymethyldihydropteridine diphosphokinase